jgi:hypothetical protein
MLLLRSKPNNADDNRRCKAESRFDIQDGADVECGPGGFEHDGLDGNAMTTSICVEKEDRDDFNRLRIEHQAKEGKLINQQAFFHIIKEKYKGCLDGK